jgi:hypothetical protein
MGDPHRHWEVLADDPLLLTPDEAATVLRIACTTIYAFMRASELRLPSVGRAW